MANTFNPLLFNKLFSWLVWNVNDSMKNAPLPTLVPANDLIHSLKPSSNVNTSVSLPLLPPVICQSVIPLGFHSTLSFVYTYLSWPWLPTVETVITPTTQISFQDWRICYPSAEKYHQKTALSCQSSWELPLLRRDASHKIISSS